MNCYYCQKKLKPKKTTYNINRKGYDVILREVSALVCQECGEVFYEEKNVKKIQSLIKEIDKKSEAVRKFESTDPKPRFAVA